VGLQKKTGFGLVSELSYASRACELASPRELTCARRSPSLKLASPFIFCLALIMSYGGGSNFGAPQQRSSVVFGTSMLSSAPE
jgi:hypothetical protein